jgi:hypothetical protein
MFDVSHEVICTSIVPNVIIHLKNSICEYGRLEIEQLGSCGEYHTWDNPSENVRYFNE